MARRPKARPPTDSVQPADAKVPADGASDGAAPTPWEALAFAPLRELAKIADPEERRLAALDRLESIQRVAANRARTVHNRVVYDPDGNTILKAEEMVQRILAIDPTPPKPASAETLAPFESAPRALQAVK